MAGAHNTIEHLTRCTKNDKGMRLEKDTKTYSSIILPYRFSPKMVARIHRLSHLGTFAFIDVYSCHCRPFVIILLFMLPISF